LQAVLLPSTQPRHRGKPLASLLLHCIRRASPEPSVHTHTHPQAWLPNAAAGHDGADGGHPAALRAAALWLPAGESGGRGRAQPGEHSAQAPTCLTLDRERMPMLAAACLPYPSPGAGRQAAAQQLPRGRSGAGAARQRHAAAGDAAHHHPRRRRAVRGWLCVCVGGREKGACCLGVRVKGVRPLFAKQAACPLSPLSALSPAPSLQHLVELTPAAASAAQAQQRLELTVGQDGVVVAVGEGASKRAFGWQPQVGGGAAADLPTPVGLQRPLAPLLHPAST
jgi:hypothetical protein